MHVKVLLIAVVFCAATSVLAIDADTALNLRSSLRSTRKAATAVMGHSCSREGTLDIDVCLGDYRHRQSMSLLPANRHIDHDLRCREYPEKCGRVKVVSLFPKSVGRCHFCGGIEEQTDKDGNKAWYNGKVDYRRGDVQNKCVGAAKSCKRPCFKASTANAVGLQTHACGMGFLADGEKVCKVHAGYTKPGVIDVSKMTDVRGVCPETHPCYDMTETHGINGLSHWRSSFGVCMGEDGTRMAPSSNNAALEVICNYAAGKDSRPGDTGWHAYRGIVICDGSAIV